MHWIEAAKRALDMSSEKLVHGAKQTEMARVASRLGYTRQSLQSVIAAYRFLESMAAYPEVQRALSSLPYSSVEVYCRWARHDLLAANAHAIKAASHGLSVKAVIRAERKARPSMPATPGSLARFLTLEGGRRGGFRDVVFSAAIEAHLTRLGVAKGPASNWGFSQVSDPYSLALGIREVITFYPAEARTSSPDRRWTHHVALVEVGERALAEGYRKQARGLMARGVAATTRYPIVLVVAPDYASLRGIAGMLPKPFDEVVGSRGPAPFVTQADCIGGVMFTSTDTLWDDLYGG